MKRYSIVIVVVVFLLSLLACNNGIVYDKQKEIKEAAWKIEDVKKFNVEITDTTSLFDFYIIIRNTVDYPYANLYLFLSTLTPEDEVAKDTLQFLLADKEGRWLGNGSGNYRENVFLFQHGIQFPQTGTYSFEFTQAMRDSSLYGVSDIGIRIEKVTQ